MFGQEKMFIYNINSSSAFYTFINLRFFRLLRNLDDPFWLITIKSVLHREALMKLQPSSLGSGIH